MGRGRPELWENTVRRALSELGGEADETAILRWVQDNRRKLGYSWQSHVHAALHDHGDGKGRAWFEPVPGRPKRWRLAGPTPSKQPELPATPEREQVRRLGRLILKALHEPEAGGLSALEQYLLAIVAYKLAWHEEAVQLIDRSLARGLAENHRREAALIRSVCDAKAGGWYK